MRSREWIRGRTVHQRRESNRPTWPLFSFSKSLDEALMHANAVVKSPNQRLQSFLFLACNLFFVFSQPVGLVELAAKQH